MDNEPKSVLEGVSEHDVVTVHNPLSDVFVAKIGRSLVARPNRAPRATGNGNADSFMQGINAGIDRGGHTSMLHTQQTIEMKSGQTLRMPGDIARIVVRQIVKEMMQRMGAKKQMADPHFIMEYEKKVVLNHESMLTNLSVESAEERMQRQLNELNQPEKLEEKQDEQAFPTESTGNARPAASNSKEPVETARRGSGTARAKAN